MDLEACRQLLAVVEHGNITSAARTLGVSRPALSRRLTALEDALDTTLLLRTTRSVRPTVAGARLVEQLRPVFQQLTAIETQIEAARDDVVGMLTVSAPPAIASVVSMVCAGLLESHPRLRVHLTSEVSFADLRSGRIDVALRAGVVRDPELVVRPLGSARIRAVASVDYLERAAPLEHPDDLEHHTVLLNSGPDGQPMTTWPLLSGSRVVVRGRFGTNDQAALLEAVLADRGIALLNDTTYAPDVDRGRIRLVLADIVGTSLPFQAVTTHRRRQPTRVRVFIDAMAEAMGLASGAQPR